MTESDMTPVSDPTSNPATPVSTLGAVGTNVSTDVSEAPGPTAASADETVTIVVNGVTLQKTPGELKAAAQKFLAGEDKLREAADLRKTMTEELGKQSEAARIGELVIAGYRNKDQAAVRELYKHFNYSDEDIESIMTAMTSSDVDQVGPQTPISIDTTVTTDDAAQIKALEERLENQEARLQHHDAARMQILESEIVAEARRRVDTDDNLGKMVKRAGPRSEVIYGLVNKAVDRRIQEAKARGNQGLGPQIFDDAIAEVRNELKDLDISSGATAIPGISSTLAGPSGFHPETKPKEASIGDTRAFRKFIQDTLRHKLVEASLNP